jgi:hypothetical protein
VTLTPLELPGWLEFNTWRTGLKAHRFSAAPDGGPEIRAVFYVDRRGRLKLPPTNPYIPIVFRSARQRPSGRTAEWLRAAAPLVDEMRRRGIADVQYLPPDVDDVRPWRGRGFLVGVRYTYCLDFPFDPALTDRTHKQHADKAARLGMTVERVTDVEPVIECLAETEARKGLSLRIGDRELRTALDLLGPDSLRLYVCFDPLGRAASACVIAHSPGERAIGWIAGTKTEDLADGASNLLWRSAFDNLASAGATGVDFCGANVESIATFKSRWGSRLVPSYTVRTYSARAAARFLADWVRSQRLPSGG